MSNLIPDREKAREITEDIEGFIIKNSFGFIYKKQEYFLEKFNVSATTRPACSKCVLNYERHDLDLSSAALRIACRAMSSERCNVMMDYNTSKVFQYMFTKINYKDE